MPDRKVLVAAGGVSRGPGSVLKWFNGLGCGFGVFAFGVGYGAIAGGGVGYGIEMPYRRPTLFFGVGFGPFVGFGLGVGRVLGMNFASKEIDWEEVMLGQKSWGFNPKAGKKPVKKPQSIQNGEIPGSTSKAIAR